MIEDSPNITINPIGDHAVGDIITNFVTIHDTWDQNNHLIQDGNWDNIMTNWVRP